MFISKKKFNEAIAEAKKETEMKIWENQRFNELEGNLHRRIDVLERRIIELESKGKHKRKDNGKDNGIMPNWRY